MTYEQAWQEKPDGSFTRQHGSFALSARQVGGMMRFVITHQRQKSSAVLRSGTVTDCRAAMAAADQAANKLENRVP